MTWDQMLQAVRLQLQEVTDLLWPADRTGQIQAKLESLEGRLQQRYQALLLQRRQIEGLRGRLEQLEQRVAWLTERVATYHHVRDQRNAWRHALDLDQARRVVARNRAQLRDQEEIYQDRLHDLHHVQRRLDLLRAESHAALARM
jgi:hypothetical protein